MKPLLLWCLLALLPLASGCATHQVARQAPVSPADAAATGASTTAPAPSVVRAASAASAALPAGRDSALYAQGQAFARSCYRSRPAVTVGYFVLALATGPILPLALRDRPPQPARHLTTKRQTVYTPMGDVLLARRATVTTQHGDEAQFRSADFQAGYRQQVLLQRRRSLRVPLLIGSISFGLGLAALVAALSFFSPGMPIRGM